MSLKPVGEKEQNCVKRLDANKGCRFFSTSMKWLPPLTLAFIELPQAPAVCPGDLWAILHFEEAVKSLFFKSRLL